MHYLILCDLLLCLYSFLASCAFLLFSPASATTLCVLLMHFSFSTLAGCAAFLPLPWVACAMPAPAAYSLWHASLSGRHLPGGRQGHQPFSRWRNWHACSLLPFPPTPFYLPTFYPMAEDMRLLAAPTMPCPCLPLGAPSRCLPPTTFPLSLYFMGTGSISSLVLSCFFLEHCCVCFLGWVIPFLVPAQHMPLQAAFFQVLCLYVCLPACTPRHATLTVSPCATYL